MIHNDCRLRIGTVLLAVPWFGRTVLEGAVLGGGLTQGRGSPLLADISDVAPPSPGFCPR